MTFRLYTCASVLAVFIGFIGIIIELSLWHYWGKIPLEMHFPFILCLLWGTINLILDVRDFLNEI